MDGLWTRKWQSGYGPAPEPYGVARTTAGGPYPGLRPVAGAEYRSVDAESGVRESWGVRGGRRITELDH